MEVKLLPVCSNCGYTFKDGILIRPEGRRIGNITHISHSFKPNRCPRCKEYIKEIVCNSDTIKKE